MRQARIRLFIFHFILHFIGRVFIDLREELALRTFEWLEIRPGYQQHVRETGPVVMFPDGGQEADKVEDKVFGVS